MCVERGRWISEPVLPSLHLLQLLKLHNQDSAALVDYVVDGDESPTRLLNVIQRRQSPASNVHLYGMVFDLKILDVCRDVEG